MKTSVIHGQKYEMYSWNTLGEDVFQLSKKIIESGKEFDRIIALAKGGLAFSKSLVDYLDVQDISSIQIEFYTGINSTNKTPVITQSLPVSIKNQRVLIFDDLVDYGGTMKLATQYIAYHGAESITTATLLRKPWTTFEVDFYVRDTEAWVIFPNEIRETITTLRTMWRGRGDSDDVIHQQLLEVGFTEDQVALFANLK